MTTPINVTVFGGSRVEVDSEEYLAALELGRRLAHQGFSVVTGGYNGVMEAVSRGAKEAGGTTIGVTVEVIARNFERVPNSYLDQEMKTTALLERIDRMVELSCGFVVMPGGAGTLAELGIVWNLALLGAMFDKPIVVVGAGWERVLRTMIEQLHTIERDLEFLIFAPDVDAAVDRLAERVGQR